MASIRSADIVFDDTLSVLHALNQRGLRFALATSASKASADLVLSRLGVASLFDVVVTADDIEQAKPFPDVFNQAIRALNLTSDEVVIVEDSVAGVQAGLAANARLINVRHRVDGIDHPNFLGFCDDLHALLAQIVEVSS